MSEIGPKMNGWIRLMSPFQNPPLPKIPIQIFAPQKILLCDWISAILGATLFHVGWLGPPFDSPVSRGKMLQDYPLKKLVRDKQARCIRMKFIK